MSVGRILRWLIASLFVITLVGGCQSHSTLSGVNLDTTLSQLEAQASSKSIAMTAVQRRSLTQLESKIGRPYISSPDDGSVAGGDWNWGVEFRAHTVGVGVFQVEVDFLETYKLMSATIDYVSQTVDDVSVLNLDSKTETSTSLAEILAARGTLRSLSTSQANPDFSLLFNTMAGEALLSTLRILGTTTLAVGKTCVSLGAGPLQDRPPVIDLCPRLGKPAIAVYTIDGQTRYKRVEVSADFTNGSGRCGIEGDGFLTSLLLETNHITRDCFNHDECVVEECSGTEDLERILCNTFFSECADEFCLAINDFFFAPDCPLVEQMSHNS